MLVSRGYMYDVSVSRISQDQVQSVIHGQKILVAETETDCLTGTPAI